MNTTPSPQTDYVPLSGFRPCLELASAVRLARFPLKRVLFAIAKVRGEPLANHGLVGVDLRLSASQFGFPNGSACPQTVAYLGLYKNFRAVLRDLFPGALAHTKADENRDAAVIQAIVLGGPYSSLFR